MITRRRPWGAAAAVVSAVSVFTLMPATDALAAPMPDYPSWDDVEAAKANQSATQTEVAQLEAALTSLENQADALSRSAQIVGESYLQAKSAADDAAKRVTSLTTQATSAQTRADESARRAGAVIARLARTGGGDVTLSLLLGSSKDTDALLGQLSTMTKLSESSTEILQQAIFDKNQATSLADQATSAEKKSRTLADAAQTAYTAAADAAAAAEAHVAAQQATVDTVYAQLASLKGTTADVERAYRVGQAAAAAASQVAAVTAPAAGSGSGAASGSGSAGSGSSGSGSTGAGSSGSAGSGSSGSGSTAPVVTPSTPATTTPVVTPPATTAPAPVASAVEQAIAYAQAQLGDGYALGGAGPDWWDCSGLTMQAYGSAGVYLGGHGATWQYNLMAAQGRLVPASQMQRGDLIFYSTGGSTSAEKYHVAIYLGGGQMIEAPKPGVPVRTYYVRSYDLVPYVGRPTG